MHFRYFWIPLPDTIDRLRLLNACQRLVQRHESLRSGFIRTDERGRGEIFQAIFSGLDIQLEEHPAVQSLAQHCRDDKNRMAEPPVDGKPPFQWDGFSLANITDDLSRAYNGLPFPPVAQFADHTHAARASQTGEAYNIWRRVLGDSQMTSLRGNLLPLDHERQHHSGEEERSNARESPYTVRVTKDVAALPSLPINTSTTALIKTAWAVILIRSFTPTQESAGGVCKDVVFGQVTNGRGLGIPHEDRIVGPCTNVIPVRVRFSESTKSLDLLQQVQQQYLTMREVENVEFGDILRHCTSWPSDTQYGSFVRFQNYDFSPAYYFDGVTCQGTLYHLPNRPSDTVNVAVYPHDTHLSIELNMSNQTLDQRAAEFVVDEFCKVVQELGSACNLATAVNPVDNLVSDS